MFLLFAVPLSHGGVPRCRSSGGHGGIGHGTTIGPLYPVYGFAEESVYPGNFYLILGRVF
ncbi:MAG: hypothetical protein ACLFM5_11595 [Spirochaetaceae bacterium]